MINNSTVQNYLFGERFLIESFYTHISHIRCSYILIFYVAKIYPLRSNTHSMDQWIFNLHLNRYDSHQTFNPQRPPLSSSHKIPFDSGQIEIKWKFMCFNKIFNSFVSDLFFFLC